MKKYFSPILALLLFFGIPGTLFAAISDNFIGGDIFQEALPYLYENKLVEGYPDGNFHEDQKINRAEFITMVMKAAKIFPSKNVSNCFSDLELGAWYVPYVCSAKQKGWIQGYKDGTFHPERPVAFIEGIKMMLQSRDIPLDDYNDHSGVVRVWYESYLPKAYDIGFFAEILERNSLEESLYRGEAAQMLYLLDRWYKDYQQASQDFQKKKSILGNAGLSYMNPSNYPKPWSMKTSFLHYPVSDHGSFRKIGKFYDADGKEIPLGSNHRNVNRYGDWLTFTYPYGNVLSVNLKTLAYRFDQLPADFPAVYFNGTHYLLETTYNCESLDTHLSSKEFCAIKLFSPATKKIYHVRSKHDSTQDEHGETVYDVGILNSGSNFLLLANTFYECHRGSACIPNHYYYRMTEGGISLSSMIFFDVDKAKNEFYLGINIYEKNQAVKKYALLTGIDKDKFYEGLFEPGSQFEGLTTQLVPKIKQLYHDFYTAHRDMRPYLYQNIFERQNPYENTSMYQEQGAYEKAGCRNWVSDMTHISYCF